MSLVKQGIKNVVRPFFRPYMARMRAMVRDELAHSLQQSDIPPTPPTQAWKTNNFYHSPLVPYRIDRNFFSKFSSDGMRRLFTDNVQHVCLETHRLCNRKCWFCPHCYPEISPKPIYISDSLFAKIVNELADIHYCATLSLSNYNEPLVASEKLLGHIRYARKQLPNAQIHFNTNGDYLTKSLLYTLYDAGISRICITVYIDDKKPGVWNYEDAILAIRRYANKFDFVPSFYTTPNPEVCASFHRLPSPANREGLYIWIHCEDHQLSANTRGDSLPKTLPIDRVEHRSELCIEPFNAFAISASGLCGVCSNILTWYDKHNEFLVGDCNTSTIFEIFSGPIFTSFRKNLVCDINSYPCNTCSNYVSNFTFLEIDRV
jgi:hypothetical protein